MKQDKSAKIYLAGHRGLVGSAIMRELERKGYSNIVTRSHADLDLTRQAETEAFFDSERPKYVILAAAKVGGIGANSKFPAQFIYDNLAIAQNIIHASYKTGVAKLLNLGSSCIYPKLAAQPLKEEYLLSGGLEPTNEAYALAKIAAIKLCKHYNDQYGTNFISAMPTNMYGPGDNYDLFGSHVLPAMIRKFHMAKAGEVNAEFGIKKDRVTLWGDGSALREFLFSDDLARAIVFLLEEKNYADLGEFINVGSQTEITIKGLALLVREVVYGSDFEKCTIEWDSTKPNGTPRKLMDSSKLFGHGWIPQVHLAEGIEIAYRDFLSRVN